MAKYSRDECKKELEKVLNTLVSQAKISKENASHCLEPATDIWYNAYKRGDDDPNKLVFDFLRPYCLKKVSKSTKSSKQDDKKYAKSTTRYISIPNCIYENDLQNLKAAIESGTNLEDKDDYGYTALLLAASFNKPDSFKILLESGANINATTKYSMNCLMIAASKNGFEIIELLLKNNIDIDWQDTDGKTALIYACEYDALDSIKVLLQYNPDITIKDHYGKTARDYCKDNTLKEFDSLTSKIQAE